MSKAKPAMDSQQRKHLIQPIARFLHLLHNRLLRCLPDGGMVANPANYVFDQIRRVRSIYTCSIYRTKHESARGLKRSINETAKAKAGGFFVISVTIPSIATLSTTTTACERKQEKSEDLWDASEAQWKKRNTLFSVHSEKPAVQAALDAGFAFEMKPCRNAPQQASQESGAFSPVSSPPQQPLHPSL